MRILAVFWMITGLVLVASGAFVLLGLSALVLGCVLYPVGAPGPSSGIALLLNLISGLVIVAVLVLAELAAQVPAGGADPGGRTVPPTISCGLAKPCKVGSAHRARSFKVSRVPSSATP